MRTYFDESQADFTCKHCGRFVSARTAVSGVGHRNHCPYCLHSRHMDLFGAGDRLCACKALMAPVGLTRKPTKDKYAAQHGGELMLVHRCTHCGSLSLNRIAADDDPVMMMAAFERSLGYESHLRQQCQQMGITLLQEGDRQLVERHLYGPPASPAPDNARPTPTFS